MSETYEHCWQEKLVVGITSSALFDLREADSVYNKLGLPKYREYMWANEAVVLKQGTGFPLVKALLAINKRGRGRLVEIALISRNDADSGFRIFRSIEAYKLDIACAAFRNGRSTHEYLDSFSCDVFLSANRSDVVKAVKRNLPAGLVYSPPAPLNLGTEEVRIAFDGDAVLFSADADNVYRKKGLEAFYKYEEKREHVPLDPGPFKAFLDAISRIQKRFSEKECPIRTSLVTARSFAACKRPIRTFRVWGVRLDESFFMSGVEKWHVLRHLKPHIFFDDQRQNLKHIYGGFEVAGEA